MGAIDTLVVGGYCLALMMVAAWMGRRQSSAVDYHVGGRQLPWWSLALSTLATQSSANSFIGIPAYVALAPGGGLTWLQYELALPLALWTVMLVFTPVFRGRGLVSIYEYLQQRFDRATRLLLSAVFLLSRAAATGIALYAAAVVVEVCTGWPLLLCILVMGVLVVVYDLMGGMRVVVWTDVMQMVLLLGGLALAIGLSLDRVGGWAGLLAFVPTERWVAIDPSTGLGDGSKAPFWGFAVGGFVLYVAYYGVDQSQVQRQLAARDVRDAHRVLLANAVLRMPLTMLYALLGLCLAALCATDAALGASMATSRPDQLVPRFIVQYLPDGLRGLLVAALLAAAMSSLDSALNSLSAATLRDFVPKLRSDRAELLAARACTMAWGCAIVLFALGAPHLPGTVVELINKVGALFYGPLIAAFAAGILDRRATGPAVRAGVAVGLATNLVLMQVFGPSVFWMWWNVSGLLAAATVCFVLSRLGAAPVGAPVGRAADFAAVKVPARELAPLGLALLAYTALLAVSMSLLPVVIQGAARSG